MRPVNLIPPDQRRGSQAQLRSGPLAYVLVAALAAGLLGVVALVLTGNQISERKSEVATLEAEDAKVAAKAERLAAFIQFQELREQRVATMTSLADSRFDWDRVMQEFALILPSDVWLVSLKATATPGVIIEANGGGGAAAEQTLRKSIPGPALELTGCASSQEAVASFVTALKDIDGVTRVGVASSNLPDSESGAGDVSGGSESGSEDCRTRPWIPKFEIAVAFDAAPIPIAGSATEEVAAPAPPPPAEEAASTESSEGG